MTRLKVPALVGLFALSACASDADVVRLGEPAGDETVAADALTFAENPLAGDVVSPEGEVSSPVPLGSSDAVDESNLFVVQDSEEEFQRLAGSSLTDSERLELEQFFAISAVAPSDVKFVGRLLLDEDVYTVADDLIERSRELAVVQKGRVHGDTFTSTVGTPGGIEQAASTIYARTSANLEIGRVDFLVKSGRAVMYPIYKSTYERADSIQSDYSNTSVFYRDHMLMWAKDLRRSIDYLETRGDIDSTKIAYFGLSWGGWLGGVMNSVEPRIKAVVLYVAGLAMDPARPEADVINFLPRVKQPVLMLNGRHDHFFPVETSQKPFFRLLGTPQDKKKYVMYEGGHFVPRTQLIAESLSWLDKYLGPVK